ncbi:MAG: phosphomethylpyrimidine synthase ThiC, partial [Rhodospirillales bacterium]
MAAADHTPSSHTPSSVTTGPIPGSRKTYVAAPGRHGAAVPFREVALQPEANEPPVRLYDTSGPYTDPSARIDIRAGLERRRTAWIVARGDVEDYDGRAVTAADNGYAEAH